MTASLIDRFGMGPSIRRLDGRTAIIRGGCVLPESPIRRIAWTRLGDRLFFYSVKVFRRGIFGRLCFEQLCALEDEYAVHYSRGATLYLNPG